MQTQRIAKQKQGSEMTTDTGSSYILIGHHVVDRDDNGHVCVCVCIACMTDCMVSGNSNDR